jgi:hypothetical protein
VDQISLPYRIGLVALLVVAGLWFVVLRPKPATQTTPVKTAPGVTGLTNDVKKAKGAVDASNKSADATNAAVNGVGGSASTTTPSSGAAGAARKHAKSGKTPGPGLADDAVAGDPSRSVLASVDAGKVAVVLFWNRKSSDDRATRQALRGIDRHHGKVVTRAIPISQIGKYDAITRNAQIVESPTVLVIGAGGKARSITGYTQVSEINDLVDLVRAKH